MEKKYIIYSPFIGTNAYIENMKRCWGSIYKVISPETAEKNISILRRTKAIVLNWVESELDFEKKKHLIWYKVLGIKIIWIFHNKIPHDAVGNSFEAATAKKNIRFMVWLSDAVILHSKSSKVYLYEYRKCLRKVFYVPHVDYDRQYRWAYKYTGSNIGEDFKFIFQGHIEPYKNIELLIRVFKELNLPHCQLRIAGKPYSDAFAQEIQKKSEGANIILNLTYLTVDEVGEEIRKGHVVVLPYDVRSSMNSGAMLTVFSNRRTVIVSNNAMAQDYRDKDFLYVYDYANHEDHYRQLKAAMKQAYESGMEANREKGERAYEYTRKHNNDFVVIERLNKIMECI